MTRTYTILPEETWAEARSDYLSGCPAELVCRRHGMGLSAFRQRARREGWRRADSHDDVSPDDDEAIYGDVEIEDLEDMTRLRMVAAISRGSAVEAARWKRLYDILSDEAAALHNSIYEEALQSGALEAARAARGRQPELHHCTVAPAAPDPKSPPSGASGG